MASLEIIAAVARNRVIGIDGHMPWHLPADLAHFKAITLGHDIVMGRRTFESIGKVLPGRRNIMVSQTFKGEIAGLVVVPSLEAACELVGAKTLMVIGGAGLYREALEHAKVLHLTHIDADFDGDTYFPDWHKYNFECVDCENCHDDKLNLDYSFKTWRRL